MKFNQLKYIIGLIKKGIRCPQCNKAFHSNEIDLVDIYQDEGILEAYCETCKTGLSINLEMEQFTKGLPQNIVKQMSPSEISDSEVKGISQTLKTHKGGLQDLFNKPDSPAQ